MNGQFTGDQACRKLEKDHDASGNVCGVIWCYVRFGYDKFSFLAAL